MSLITKVRLPKFRHPEASPKERTAWEHFIAFAEALGAGTGPVSPLVTAELDRLCERGNPIALHFRERLSAAQFVPRKAHEEPFSAPPKRRIARIGWGKPPSEDG